MSLNPAFSSEYIDFRDYEEGLTVDEKHAKVLTSIGAAAVSLLCYEAGDNLPTVLEHDRRFQLVKNADIISAVWSLEDHAVNTSQTAPILAWSVRLQTVFIGFRGTQVARDLVSDVDARKTASPELASRFHAGFFSRAVPFSVLIKELADKYKVVVCGHSMGGAMATIAAYHAMTHHYGVRTVHNTWEWELEPSASARISTVTFGAPAMMVLEAPGTTAEMRKDLKKNFHHIINPNDVIPFSINRSILMVSRFVDRSEEIFASLLRTAWPGSELALAVFGRTLRLWTDSNGTFAHYGSLYLLDPYEGNGRTMQCSLITAARQIPSSPELNDIAGLWRFHSMEHYSHCLGETLDCHYAFPEINPTTMMNSLQFQRDCLPPLVITDCKGKVSDDRVVISATIKPSLIRFLTKGITILLGDTRVSVSGFSFSMTNSFNQTQLEITQMMNPEDPAQTFIEMADAMLQNLRIRDSFGRRAHLPVREMKHASMQDVSLSTTFESIRHAMIIAFADHMAKVHSLKLQSKEEGIELGSAKDLERQRDSRVLTDKAKQVVEQVDALVANASPHLVVAKLGDAFWVIDELWATDPSYVLPRGQTPADERVAERPTADAQAEDVAGIVDRIPDGCPEGLRALLSNMLCSFEQNGIRLPFTQEVWEREKRPRMDQAWGECATLACTLQDFGAKLYGRETVRAMDPDKGIQHAIEQARHVLSVMRFCHLVIITQLDAPEDWCVDVYEDHVMKTPGAVASIISAGYSLYSTTRWVAAASVVSGPILGAGWVVIASAAGLAVGLASFLASWGVVEQLPHGRRHQLQLNFDGMLKLSVQALNISLSPFDIIEASITALLKQTPTKRGNLPYWQTRLKDGLKRLGGLPRHLSYEPTCIWAKWLHDVGRIGQLRRLVSDRLYIGVEGPTEAGKSSLLTTLTGAHPDVFRAGFGSEFRTTELQSYTPDNFNTVFCDCPGSDDQDPHIREMARMFRDMMDVIIFVIPCGSVRAQSTEAIYKEIAEFIGEHRRPRPFRILLNKVDKEIEFDEEDPMAFEKELVESKKRAVNEIRRLGKFPADYKIKSRQAFRGMIVVGTESLEDVIYPFSTYAQMSNDKKALSDCNPNVKRKIKDPELHHTLYQLAESGILWDIESLRAWLRGLVPNGVPGSKGRVFQNS